MTADLDAIRRELAEMPGHELDVEKLELRRYTDAWAYAARHVPGLVDEIEQLREQVLKRDYWARDVVFYHELSEESGDDWFATIAKHLKAALADMAELRALFDLQYTRMTEATQRWREESRAEWAQVLPDLGELLAWLMRRADSARARANEAARLSAAARDHADDLRKKIADQSEQIADLERDRLDRDAWAVRVATEHNLYDLPLDVDDEYGAIAARLEAYRTEMAIQVEFGAKAVRMRDQLFHEVEQLRVERDAVRDAARRRVAAYQKGDEQLCADVRTIRRNLTDTGCCDACKPAVTAACNDLGQLLAGMLATDGSDTP